MIYQLLLFVVLSCPRLAAGRSWLPRPGTAVSNPGLCQRKKGIELLCLPALSPWHRVSQAQLAQPPSQQPPPWQELPGWVLAPPLPRAAPGFHPSSQSSNAAPSASHPCNAHLTNCTFSNHKLQTMATSTCMPLSPNPLTSFRHQTSPLSPRIYPALHLQPAFAGRCTLLCQALAAAAADPASASCKSQKTLSSASPHADEAGRSHCCSHRAEVVHGVPQAGSSL